MLRLLKTSEISKNKLCRGQGLGTHVFSRRIIPMSNLRILSATARTVSILLAPNGAQFEQPEPLDWTLTQLNKGAVRSGVADTTVVFVEGLDPAQDYRLKTPLGDLDFTTPPCAGLVEAASFGVAAEADDNTAALQSAIDAVPEGGTLRLAAGYYQTGPIFLKPHMTLWLPEGAVLAAHGDRTEWPILPPHDADGRVLSTWEGVPEAMFAAPITALFCDGLAITGRGVLDAGGDRGDWWQWPKETRDGARRPRALYLAYGRDVILSGVTVRNAPSWTIHPYQCDDLKVSALRVENPPNSPNTDGLNPESCTNVAITGVAFSVGDDCIAIKAGKRRAEGNTHLAPCRDIVISHCLMERGHGAVVLGSEMSGDITDVTVRDCAFRQTDRGLRIKTRRGRGGTVADVRLSNVEMVDVPTPLAINAFYFCDADGRDDWVQSRQAAPVSDTTPHIRNISLRDVTATGVTLAAAAVLGLPEAPVTGITLENCRVSYDPNAVADVPLMACNVPATRHAGVVVEFGDVQGTFTLLSDKKALTP